MLTADTGCQCCQPRAEPYVIESNGRYCNTETIRHTRHRVW